MYYIIFYSFKHGPSPCDLLGKLRKCGLEDMGRFLLNLLHESSPYMLPSGQGTLVAPLAHRGGLVPEISTPKQLLCSGWLWPKVSAQPFLPLKMVGSHWPTFATSPHSTEPPNGMKQLKRGSQWGFGQTFPLMMTKVSLLKNPMGDLVHSRIFGPCHKTSLTTG